MGFFEEKQKTQQDNSLWCERWRPTMLSEYIGNPHLKEKVAGYIETSDIPHLLLFGKAGTGKCLDYSELIDIKMRVSDDEYQILKFLNLLDIGLSEPAKIDRYLTIKNQYNQYKNVNYLVKKYGEVNRYVFDDNISITCDKNHLVSSHGNFVHIKDVYDVDTIYGIKKLKLIMPDDAKYVYDFSLDSPHEYITSSGVICHNTTLAKLIVNNVKCDYIIINASDERGVDTIRNKVKGFASTVGFRDKKIIILDEFDYMTPDAQAMLRNLMETFSNHCRFILTCNYVEKVIQPIQSRCQTFQVIPPTKRDVAVQVAKILTAEKIKFNLKDLVPIIDASYPDIRKIINTCQLNSSNGELKIDTNTVLDSDVKTKVIKLLSSNETKQNKYKKIRQAIADSRIQDFSDFYTYLYEKVEDYGKGQTAAIILLLSEGQYKDSLVIDKEITFIATLINIIGITSS